MGGLSRAVLGTWIGSWVQGANGIECNCPACLRPRAHPGYQTAEEMNADLALLHSGKSVQRKHGLERRLKVAKRGVAALAAVLVLGIVPYYFAIHEARHALDPAKRETTERHRAEAQERAAQIEAAKSREVSALLKEMLRDVGPSQGSRP